MTSLEQEYRKLAQSKQDKNIQCITIIDSKGFTQFDSGSNIPDRHKLFELYQLSEYFFPQNWKQTRIGIETAQSLTMIRSINGKHSSDSEEQRLLICRQRLEKEQSEKTEVEKQNAE